MNHIILNLSVSAFSDAGVLSPAVTDGRVTPPVSPLFTGVTSDNRFPPKKVLPVSLSHSALPGCHSALPPQSCCVQVNEISLCRPWRSTLTALTSPQSERIAGLVKKQQLGVEKSSPVVCVQSILGYLMI